MQTSFPTMREKIIGHFKALKLAAEDYSENFHLNCKTLQIHIQSKAQSFVLHPQFIEYTNNKKRLVSNFSDEARGFAGWRPYPARDIEEFSDKIQFKKLLLKGGFLTPNYSQKQDCGFSNVIVKRNGSGFSESIKGPFKSSSDYVLNTGDSEYYEQFLTGYILRMWFWNNRPVCFEHQEMPTIKGNGKNTIRSLIEVNSKIQNINVDWPFLIRLLDHYNNTLDTILRPDEKQILDFRYSFPLAEARQNNEIIFTPNKVDELFDPFHFLGQYFQTTLKKKHQDLAYTVDAIYTDSEELWYLEANGNPCIHPKLYSEIIYTLLNEGEHNVNV